MIGRHGVGFWMSAGFRLLQHRGEIQRLIPEVTRVVQDVMKLAPQIMALAERIAPELFIEARTGRAVADPTYSVAWLQTQLKLLGFDPGPIDGFPGRRTAEAVKQFQTANGLVSDGWVGVATLAKLDELQRIRGITA